MSLRRWRETVRDDVELSPSAKLIGFMLSTYAEVDGRTASPGHVQLAESAGFSRRYIVRLIASLADAGYITKEHVGHSAGPILSGCGYNSVYTLHEPPSPRPKPSGN